MCAGQCEYSEDGPASVRVYLLISYLWRNFVSFLFFLNPCKQSSVEAETRLSYPVFYRFAAKILHKYFTIVLDQLFY